MSIGDLHHRVGGLTLAMISGWSDEEGEAPRQPSTGQSITGGYQANVAQRAAKLVNSVGTQTDRDVVMDAAVAAHPVTGEPARGADPEDREVDMRDMLTELRSISALWKPVQQNGSGEHGAAVSSTITVTG